MSSVFALYLLGAAICIAVVLDAAARRAPGTVRLYLGAVCLSAAGYAVGLGYASGQATAEAAFPGIVSARLSIAVLGGGFVGLGLALGQRRHGWTPALAAFAAALAFLGWSGAVLLAVTPADLVRTDQGWLLDSLGLRAVTVLITLASTAAVFWGGLRSLGRRRSFARKRMVFILGLQAALAAAVLMLRLLGSPELHLAGMPLVLMTAALGWAWALRHYRLAGLSGDMVLRVLDVSPNAVVLLDLAADWAIPNPAARRVLGEVPRTVDALLERMEFGGALESLQSEEEQRRLSVRLGADRVYDVTLTHHPRDGLALVALADVTAREAQARTLGRALEELKEAQNRMLVQEKQAGLGSLVAGVGHEINNPLAYAMSNLRTLSGYLDVLLPAAVEGRAARRAAAPRRLAVVGGEPPAPAEAEALGAVDARFDAAVSDARDALADALEGCRRISGIVGSMRTLSRQNEPEQVYCLSRLAQDAVKVARTSIDVSLRLETELGSDLPVRCVPGDVSRVVSNLVVNAGQALGGSGSITVRSWADGDDAVVEVADDGPGIPPEHQTRVFEPFFTTKAPGEGTGLGLAISYETVRRHGGEIDLDSEPGRGARFRVRLPLAYREDGLRAAFGAYRGGLPSHPVT